MVLKKIACSVLMGLLVTACGGGGGGGNSSSSSSPVSNTSTVTCPTTYAAPSYAAVSATTGIELTLSPTLTTSIPAGCALQFSSSSLPAGLSLNSASGKITGSGSAAGAGSFTVSLSVAGGATVTSQPIAYNFVAPVATACGPAGYNNSSAAYADITATANGTIDPQSPTMNPAFPAGCSPTFTATNLPNGLSINASTGQITGMPLTQSKGMFSVNVAMPNYPTRTTAVNYNVASAAIIPSLTSPQAGSIAALNLPTPEGLWIGSNSSEYQTLLIASDGAFSAAKVSVVSSSIFSTSTLFGNLVRPMGTSQWTMQTGGTKYSTLGNVDMLNEQITSGTGTYTSQGQFSGSYVSGNATTQITSLLYSPFNAFAISSLADIAGTYTSTGTTTSTKLIVDAQGALSGTYTSPSGVCTLGGTIDLKEPSTKKNMFVMSLTLNAVGNGCGATGSFSGLAAKRVMSQTSGSATSSRYALNFMLNGGTAGYWRAEPLRQ